MVWALAADRKINWALAGYPSGIPTIATEFDAKVRFGLKGNGIADDGAGIQAAIDACSGNASTPKAVALPAGTFLSTRQLVMKPGVTLRGASISSTSLKFKFGLDARHCIVTSKRGGGTWIPVRSGYAKGSTTLVLSAPAASFGFVSGAVVEIRQNNDPAYFPSKWATLWNVKSVGEISTVQSASGNTIVLTRALSFAYSSTRSPEIRTVLTIDNVGLEDMYITRVDTGASESSGGEDAMFYFYQARKCWLHRVESDHAVRHHLVMSRGYQNEMRTCYFHHADKYGPANGYGIGPRVHTTACLFEDNVFSHITDAYMFETGANSNVFSFNYSELPQHPSGSKWDCDFHGNHSFMNLIEGNKMAGYRIGGNWGPAPRNTLFRDNMYADKIWVLDGSKFTNVVGCELTSPTPVITVASDATDGLYHANELGATISYAAGEDHTLPASLVKTAKPSWWNDACPWPCFGPDVVNGSNPAQLRAKGGAVVPPPIVVPPPAGGGNFTVDLAITSGCFKVEFDVTPLDAVVDYCNGLQYSLAPAQDTVYKRLAVTLRLSAAGFFDARNGANYEAKSVLAYTQDVKYHVRMMVDMVNNQYDAYVGAVPIAIAYAFRTEQAKASKLDQFLGVATTGTAKVENVVAID